MTLSNTYQTLYFVYIQKERFYFFHQMKVLRIFVSSLQIKIYIFSHPKLALAIFAREMSPHDLE